MARADLATRVRALRILPLWVALGIVAVVVAACSQGAAISQGELASTPETSLIGPTAVIGGGLQNQPGLIIEPTPTPEGPRPLVIASLLGETGVMAPLDGPALAGVVAEIERINGDGGVLGRTIELVRFDTNSRTSLAERRMLRLLENPPDLVIVSCDTAFSKPVLELAEEAGIVTISPCADDAGYLTGAFGPRNFTMGAPAEARGSLAARIGFDRYGSTAMVLRDVTSPEALAFCDGFERGFRELGGTVVYRDEFSYDTLEPVQDRIAENGRDTNFITVCSHVPGGIDAAPSVITMLRTLGFQAPILAGSSVDQPGWFSSVPVLGDLTFVSWSSAYGNDPDDRVNDVVRSASSNGDTPGAGVSTILGAETVEVWARAVEAGRDASPERVAASLGSFNNEPFSTGDVSFVAGARMDIGRTYRVLDVTDGQLTVFGLESVDD